MTWEQRWHPLREEWIIIAAHRQDRPWVGETIKQATNQLPPYDSSCYLCPGNKRVGGHQNPHYQQTFVFDNDHACVSWDAPPVEEVSQNIYRRKPAHGSQQIQRVCSIFRPPVISLPKICMKNTRYPLD